MPEPCPTPLGASSPDAGAESLPSWSHYYDFDLTWRQHTENVLCHLPMMRTARRLAPRRVLEVGSGTGSLAIFLSYFLRHVVSIDLADEVLARARRNNRRLRGRARFERADAFDMRAFRDGSFDLAMSQGFFEHFDDADVHRLLREQLRVARTVLFSVPNRAYGRRDRGDERLLSRRQWETILRTGGFDVLDSRDYRPLNRSGIMELLHRMPPTMSLLVIGSRQPALHRATAASRTADGPIRAE